jgi:hypothetical protein
VGNGNTIQEVDAYANGGNGIAVPAAATHSSITTPVTVTRATRRTASYWPATTTFSRRMMRTSTAAMASTLAARELHSRRTLPTIGATKPTDSTASSLMATQTWRRIPRMATGAIGST